MSDGRDRDVAAHDLGVILDLEISFSCIASSALLPAAACGHLRQSCDNPSPGMELHPTLSPTATPPTTSHCTASTLNPTSDSTDEAHGEQEAQNAPRNRSTRPAALPPSCCKRLCPCGTASDAVPSELPPLEVSTTAQLVLPQAQPQAWSPAVGRGRRWQCHHQPALPPTSTASPCHHP